MRVATLGAVGAVAPIVPGGAAQMYGIGATDPMTNMDPKKTLLMGLLLGTVLGATGMHFYMKR